ncbi:MAG: hypothetical protein ACOCXP_03800 [Candidatus Dojkabacteria bacterium]
MKTRKILGTTMLIFIAILSTVVVSLHNRSSQGEGQSRGEDNCSRGNVLAQSNLDCIPEQEIISGTPDPKLTCNPTRNEQCRKVGINFAVTAVPEEAIARAESLNMGYTLNIANSPADLGPVAEDFNSALDKGMTPILRICVGGSCAFTDVNSYTEFLKNLEAAVGGREFYAVAGPNEPLTETWLGNREGDPVTTGQTSARYMNEVINSLNNRGKGSIKLLTPVFNATNPAMPQLIQEMKAADANFAGIDYISLNTYNTGAGDVTGFLDILKAQELPVKQYVITETGLFDRTQGSSFDESMRKIVFETDEIMNDPSVGAFLFFNSFATNPDPRFEYNHLNNSQFTQILGAECIDMRLACNN